MKWTELTSRTLKAAASECGLAVLPLGSIEAHAAHLPLGNDTFKVERTCFAAAEREPAVVLPSLFYTDVTSMRAVTGAITIRTELLIELTLDICDEAARNGFPKILLVSGHGGNAAWVALLLNRMKALAKPYLVYSYYVQLLGGEQNRPLMQSAFDQHGGEVETSIALHLYPELVDLEGRVAATAPAADPDLGGALSPYTFALRWPRAVSGDPFPATAEKGRAFFESNIDQLAACMAKVKADTETARFKEAFERRCASPQLP
jgi:creatinine amidohydrolase